jgi:putative membrane protein
MSTLFAFLHHLAAFTLVAAVAIEFILLRGPLTLASAKLLPPVDAVLGAAAGILLAVGLARVFWFEKGAAYYFTNHAFLTKFGLFLVIGLLSIVPTLEFLSWRKALRQGRLPDIKPGKIKSIRTILHVELAGVVTILLCAALMARGGWV